MGVVQGDNSLFFATAIDNTGLQRGSIDAVNLIQNMGAKIASINPFAALAIGAVTAFAAISTEAYKMSRDFEHAMKEVETISDATQKNFKGISKQVFDLSKISPDGPQKLAKAYYQIVSAGYDGVKGIKLLETASKAAVAGVTDTITAADGITTVLNAFNLEAEQATEVADVMFKTVQLGKTTFSELAANLSTVAPLAAATGIDFREVAGAVATLTKQGVPTAQAMTQIRAAIQGANKALGDGWNNTLTLQEAFQKLFEEADGSQTVLQEMVGSIEGVGGVLGVAGKNAQGAAEDLEAMGKAAGSTEDAFKRMSSSNVNEIEILRNRIRATTKGIGDAVLEMSNDIAGGLNDLFEPLDSVVEGLEQERLNVLKLESTLKDSNTTNEERLELIKELKSNYPDLLGNIDAETVSNQELTLAIKQVNDQLINKIILARKDVEINAQNETVAEKRIKLLEQEDIVKDRLVKLAEQEGITLKDNVTLLEQAQDLLKQAGPQSGGRLINPLVDFSFQVQELQTAKKNLNIQEEQENKLLEEKQKLAERLGITLEGNSKKITAETQKQLDAIKAITKEQYADNGDILKQYIDSENKVISEAAKKRKAFFDYKPKGDDPDDNAFVDYLKKREEQYNAYTLAIENNDQDLASKLKQMYGLKEQDYKTFLRNLYSATEDADNKVKILQVLEVTGQGLVDRAKQSIVSELESQPVVELGVALDTSSVNAIERQLKALQEAFNSQQVLNEDDKQLKALLKKKIEAKQKELDVARGAVQQEKGLYENLTRSLSDLNNRELRNYIQYWKERLKEAKKGTEAAQEAEGNIVSATEQIGKNTADAIRQVSGALNEASSLFSKFGDEDTAKLLEQLSGVAEGAARIAAGDIVGGSLQVLNSALTVEVVSDTAKFEAAIKKLEKAISDLDYVISKSIGQDKIANRAQALDDLKELEKQAEAAKQAELDARKEVKLLGITIGKKGSGSGTDAAKLEELEQKAEDARRKAVELREQLDELYTGTTENTIVDSIIAGLKEGKKSVSDFADGFKELMQNALLQAFQIKYLEKEINKFYDAFALAGSDSTYTTTEIEALKTLYNQIINGAQGDIEAINKILEQTGIGALGVTNDAFQQQGLTGAIRRELTEETASELTGLFRGQYDLAKQHFETSKQELSSINNIVAYSQAIANNTANTVIELQNAIIELKKIADNTEKIYQADFG
ncbi:phage tail tape measure protein [Aestuariibaculum marinum]|uniref:Phage tail tape measure protein n=1 Tax=Aestuariibaculum marinum TaxID=2683592 RepID=A0A8J6PNW9_9FLAO|nr:phage tail tape measure protein [Aestuariibaculum marinum]MBD0822650.1 phage tail tape measure protein [Aestuariibaculum marinum]